MHICDLQFDTYLTSQDIKQNLKHNPKSPEIWPKQVFFFNYDIILQTSPHQIRQSLLSTPFPCPYDGGMKAREHIVFEQQINDTEHQDEEPVDELIQFLLAADNDHQLITTFIDRDDCCGLQCK